MKKIIVHVGHYDTRAAVLEDDRLVEIYVEKPTEELVGNIYLGKVINVLPGMQAAFIDIGIGKNAFLHVYDALPPNIDEDNLNVSIKDVLKEGQQIIVQVLKEPFGNKGPRVTTHISIAGRYLVYLPEGNYVGVSKRIKDEEERVRYKELGDAIKIGKEGLIIRTVTSVANDDQIKNDLHFLRKVWENALQQSKKLSPPTLIYKDLDLVPRLARDLLANDVKLFIIDSGNEYRKIREMVQLTSPHLTERIYLYQGKEPIFDAYHVQSEIEKAIRRKVWLKSGGYLIFDKTEALTSIDVNTGKYIGQTNLEETVLRTNIEAAIEIARQLRLRDIGGIIIIDFIDMVEDEHKQKVLEVLQEEMKKDKTKSNVIGLTQLGLVEMTRKKVRQSVESSLLKSCPVCEGTGRVISEEELMSKIEKEFARYKEQLSNDTLTIETNPYISHYLMKNNGEYLNRFEKIADKKIRIINDETLSFHHYHIK